MRWPLKYQILLPFGGWTLLVIVALTAVNVWHSTSMARQETQGKLEEVVRQVAEARFPLTQPVLEQVKRFTGADLVVSGEQASGIRGTDPDILTHWEVPFDDRSGDRVNLGVPIQIADQAYFHAATDVHPTQRSASSRQVHVLLPVADYRKLWADAFWPPLWFGLAAVVPVGILSLGLASMVTRPVDRLRARVESISHGDFTPLTLSKRNDELRDLAESINRMGTRLRDYEARVRGLERVKVLGQVGAGYAHQIRNAITGARMALGIHRTECSIPDCESLQVAEHQLELVEHFLQSTLRYGVHDPAGASTVKVDDWIDGAIRLVKPGMMHHHVSLKIDVEPGGLLVRGDLILLQTCLTNLLTNALEAITAQRPIEGELSPVREVVLRGRAEQRRVVVEVIDNGPGPREEIRERLFEPLATTKSEGSGLGLPVVREIVQMHGGEIRWQRTEEGTCFEIRLPMAEKEDA
ncbi:MAG: HAMP domain-containing sensor histidine kinase [Pirellulaceae bacterium]